MNDQLFADVNEFARATQWLHPVMVGYAQYGVVLFALLLLAGWWVARRTGRGMTAALWAPVGMLLALAVNQPLVAAVAEARPYTTLHNILVWRRPALTRPFRRITPRWPVRSPPVCCWSTGGSACSPSWRPR
jgi:hypothetical protein